MSITLAAVRNQVRIKLNEMDARKVSTGILAIDGAISDSYLLLASRIPAPKLYSASAFTISANAQTFTLPTTGGLQYAGDVSIQLNSDKSYLLKSTRDEIEALRRGDTSTTGSAKPTRFALHEESDQDVQGDCWPRSAAAEACNLFSSLVVTDLRDAASMDAATIQFSRYGSAALVFYAAASLVAAMTDEDLSLRRLNPNVVGIWRADAERMLYEDEVRKHQLEDAGRTQRWIS